MRVCVRVAAQVPVHIHAHLLNLSSIGKMTSEISNPQCPCNDMLEILVKTVYKVKKLDEQWIRV